MADRTTIQRQEDHVRLEEIKQRLGVLASHPGEGSKAAQAEAQGLRLELLELKQEELFRRIGDREPLGFADFRALGGSSDEFDELHPRPPIG